MSIDEALEVEDTNENGGATERKGRATPGKRNKIGVTTESSNFLSRFWDGIREYFGGVRGEMTKVVWPDREELLRLTYIVSLVTIASAIGLGLLSFVYTWIFQVGVSDNQPLIFVGVFGLVAVAFWFFNRESSQNDNSNNRRSY